MRSSLFLVQKNAWFAFLSVFFFRFGCRGEGRLSACACVCCVCERGKRDGEKRVNEGNSLLDRNWCWWFFVDVDDAVAVVVDACACAFASRV